MKKILVLTPFYYTDDIHIEATAVVNYFVRSWAKMGMDVVVVHLPSLFPLWMRKAAKPFLKQLEAKLNATISCESVRERIYDDEGVKVFRIPMVKYKPHSRYSKNVIKNTTNKIVNYLENQRFSPDVMITHWVNPGVELLYELKKFFEVPSCLVLHSDGHEFVSVFKDKATFYRNNIDIIGFRSKSLKEAYESKFSKPSRWFYCYSGIPDSCIGERIEYKEFRDRYIYVGNLRKRKHPETIAKAMSVVYNSTDDFEMKYIGTGALETDIRNIARINGFTDAQVQFVGYLPRDQVLCSLKSSDVFIMVSSNEVFGLVYLEAMAMGCIPIGSKGEGIDGVIVDGKNGFLVPPGDEVALANTISHIRNMSEKERKGIIDAAFETAKNMTDSSVAKYYINKVFQLCNL